MEPLPEPLLFLSRLWWLGSVVLCGAAYLLVSRVTRVRSSGWRYAFGAGFAFHLLCLIGALVGLLAGAVDAVRVGAWLLPEILVFSLILFVPVGAASVIGMRCWRTLLSRIAA